MAARRHPELLARLEEASAEFGDVEVGEAHGCEALAVGDRPFALVAPGGRIAVRLPDWDLFASAFELPGSEPLVLDDQRVGHWVVLPAEIAGHADALRVWLRHAHALTAGRV